MRVEGLGDMILALGVGVPALGLKDRGQLRRGNRDHFGFRIEGSELRIQIEGSKPEFRKRPFTAIRGSRHLSLALRV